MRVGFEEVREGVRGSRRVVAMLLASCAAVLASLLVAAPAHAEFNNATPRGSFAGTHNYTITGASLRTQSNNGNACAVQTSRSAQLTGIPAGATIMRAYVYWAGSGNVDANVTFNGQNITADDTFTDNFQTFLNNTNYDLDYFGGVKDVTTRITGNGTYTLSNLTVANTDNFEGNPGADYCTPEAVIAGWALVVFYHHPSERYRYSRVYDGLKFFRGSSVTTTQSGFRVPDLQDGKVSIVTYEGDPDVGTNASSHPLDGYTEALSFDAHPLLNAGCDGTDNLYNSTIGTFTGACSTSNAYGIDIDTYDVTDYLYEGQTGAVLDYSSGNDLVFLQAQVISTTNTPVADLGIDKVHVGDYFTVGQDGAYEIVVHNYGPEIAVGTSTVTDTLPAGLTYVSGTGTGWTCSAVGQVVTCNSSQTSLAVGASLPTLTLTVAVGADAPESLYNAAEVSHPMFDGTGGNQTDDDVVEVRGSNLSTSTKTVVDQNGGEVQTGDVLRYTITIANTSAHGIDAAGVSVVDDVPANVGNLSIVSIPAGATDSSIGSGGAYGTGQVNVSGITVPSGSTRTIVFDVTVLSDAAPGAQIANTATIGNPTGPGATPSSPTLTVNASQAPATGSKVLYVYTGGSSATRTMSRTRQTTAATLAFPATQSYDFTLGAVRRPLVISPGTTINVALTARRTGVTWYTTRNVSVELLKNGSVSLGSGTGSFSSASFSAIPVTFNAAGDLAIGDTLVLRVTNTMPDFGDLSFELNQFTGGLRSTVTFLTPTVINVEGLSVHTAPYPATATKPTPWEPGDTAYIRATISDPFGDYDITNATIQLTGGNGGSLSVSGWSQKTESPDDPGAEVWEGSYTIPASPSFGTFTATVTGTEGVETPLIQHSRKTTFEVAPKALTVTKSHDGDFTAGANNNYTLVVNNTGGATIGGTTTVKDTLATGLTFVSGTGTGWTCGASGQVVTCTSTASIPANSSMAPITLVVAVAGNMGAVVTNQASVGNSTIAGGYQKPGNVDTAIVRRSDLSTSVKTVSDLNGGDANPGDTLRYTIMVIESAGYPANNVTVTDTLPFGLATPTGLNTTLTTCNGTPSIAGKTLTVTGLSLAGGASCAIVFDVQVDATAGTGLVINNTANVDNPAGEDATTNVSITVSQSQVLVAGEKVLYLYSNNTMRRVPQSGAGNNTINENSYQDFVLGSVAGALTISPGSTITLDAWLRRSGSTTTTARSVYARLLKNGTTQVGSTSNTVTFNSTAAARQQFTITAPSFGGAGNLVPGDTLTLRIYNNSGSGGNDRTVRFDQLLTGTPEDDDSRLTISTPTVVNVGNVTAYSAPYPATTQAAFYGQGETVYIRATVTDPFGFADISGGSIAIKDTGGTTVSTATLTNGTHTVGTPAGATRIYEYAYTIPAGAAAGAWTASVTANEGTEGTITHTGNGGFSVGGRVRLLKAWGAGATAGDAVTLTITGGTAAVPGSSTAPSTVVEASANATAGTTVTLTESFTSGSASRYTVTLTCTRDSDGTTITPSGTGLSRTITMPGGSVTCTYLNSITTPLSIVKLSTVYSDPINGTSNPKAIPGALVTYLIIVASPADTQVDPGSMVITDKVPDEMTMFVADLPDVPGTSPYGFTPGSSGLTLDFGGLGDATDDVDFSSDGGATWDYVPVPGAGGLDPVVTHVRFRPQGTFAPGTNAWFGVRMQLQ